MCAGALECRASSIPPRPAGTQGLQARASWRPGRGTCTGNRLGCAGRMTQRSLLQEGARSPPASVAGPAGVEDCPARPAHGQADSQGQQQWPDDCPCSERGACCGQRCPGWLTACLCGRSSGRGRPPSASSVQPERRAGRPTLRPTPCAACRTGRVRPAGPSTSWGCQPVHAAAAERTTGPCSQRFQKRGGARCNTLD